MVNLLFFININKDILDRTLQNPVAERRPLDDDATGKQSENQLKDPLPRVTSLCESMATAVGVAERALCQNAELLRDLDSLLTTQADAE